MKKIYIILMHTNTIPARIIRLATRYKYSHVAISFERNCNMTYSFGRKNINSVLDAGFVKEYKNGKFFRKFNKTECKIYEINVTDEQYYNAWHIIKNMEKHKEVYKYDIRGIILRFFGIPLAFKNRYVCSYFVASILQRAKIYKFKKKICCIEPKDFEKVNKLHEIYSGPYKMYA